MPLEPLWMSIAVITSALTGAWTFMGVDRAFMHKAWVRSTFTAYMVVYRESDPRVPEGIKALEALGQTSILKQTLRFMMGRNPWKGYPLEVLSFMDHIRSRFPDASSYPYTPSFPDGDLTTSNKRN